MARFIVAVAQAMNDNVLVNSKFVESERSHEHIYFFCLANSHLYEVAKRFLKAQKEWEEVRGFVSSLDEERQREFARITALAGQNPDWPGNRLKELRDFFFHYLSLDRAAAEAGRLPLMRGLTEAADLEGKLTIEEGGALNGIRALFADEVFVKTLTADYGGDELERLTAAFAEYQPALNRFAQAAVGRYLRELPKGIVEFDGPGEDEEL